VKFDAEGIAAATGGTVLRAGPSGPVLTDTRRLGSGGWFLAIVGARFDGHEFLPAAQEGGAFGCIVSEAPGDDWLGGAVLVEDTTVALQDLGRSVRRGFKGPVIGLTGSSGKTTMRSLIHLAVSQLGMVHQTSGNLNNHLGLPMTLAACPETAAGLVLELGTSSPGEIAFLDAIACPDVRLIVNVGPAHLEELGGLEGVAHEKGALFRNARPGDTVVVNLDDSYVRAIPVPEGVRQVTWGRHPAADIRLVDCRMESGSFRTQVSLRSPVGDLALELPVLGEHMAHNAAGAIAVAYALGLDLEGAVQALSAYEPVGMRMRVENLPNGVLALNDAYNANPASMKASLGVLSSMPGRRVAIMGDMLELGPLEADFHEDVARYADSLSLDLVVLVGERMVAAVGEVSATPVQAFQMPSEAVPFLKEWLSNGDVVLFKGSRGARVEQILQSLTDDHTDQTGAR
jgi:UDP-N-acetylmuramoyl-tripeptide--D-alanyl-D-alanine ligase